ncbi:hypothetical protein ACXJJ3_37715 [Kribbella sp. WER1]
MSDNAGEGVSLGLHRTDGTAKPAWSTYALANRNDLTPARLSCGFETLPYITLRRGCSPAAGKHFASSRLLPSGVTEEQTYRVLRQPAAGTAMPLYRCRRNSDNDHLITVQSNCEGYVLESLLGYVMT